MKKENSRMANLTLRMVLRMMYALALLLVFLPSRAFATSFVCAKAKTQVEKFICASPSLSELDDAVHSAYIAARKADATGAIISQQRAWLKERNACTTPECVENLYNRRLEQLGQQYNPSSSTRRIWPYQNVEKINGFDSILQTAPKVTLPYPDIWGVVLPVGVNIFAVYPAAHGDFIFGASAKEKSGYEDLTRNNTLLMTALFSGKQWRISKRDPAYIKNRGYDGLLSFNQTKEIVCPVPIQKNDPDMRNTCYAEINHRFPNGNQLLYVHTDYELPYCYRERYFRYLALLAPDGRVLRQVTPIVVSKADEKRDSLGGDPACYGLLGGKKFQYLNNWTRAPEITQFVPLNDGTFLLGFYGFYEKTAHKGFLIRFDQNFSSRHPSFGKEVFMVDTKILEKMGSIHTDQHRTIHQNALRTDRKLYNYLTNN